MSSRAGLNTKFAAIGTGGSGIAWASGVATGTGAAATILNAVQISTLKKTLAVSEDCINAIKPVWEILGEPNLWD